jgi:hypothetical protein
MCCHGSSKKVCLVLSDLMVVLWFSYGCLAGIFRDVLQLSAVVLRLSYCS